MINRFTTENTWYGDRIPSGFRGSLINNLEGILTNFNGTIELPLQDPNNPNSKENVLFLRIYYWNNIVYLAGQGGKLGNALIWNSVSKQWHALSISFATNPIYFYQDKVLVVTSGNTIDVYSISTYKKIDQIKHQVGVNGIRWIENTGLIVTGDDTYNGSLDPRINVSEYTKLDSYYIGQSYVDGCSIILPGATRDKDIRKTIEKGDCIFVRAYKDGTKFYVTIVKQPEHRTVFFDFDESDIPSFSDEPTKEPPVEIPPKKDPPKMTVPNESSRLNEFKQQYGTVNNDDESKRKFIFAFASWLNGKLGTTRWGGKARSGVNDPSKATLGYWIGDPIPTSPTDGKLHVFQLISSSGSVGWDNRAENNDPGYNNIDARWFPSAVSTIPVDNPPKDNPPNSDLEKRVLKLETELLLLKNGDVLKVGDTISLQTEDGFYVCAEGSGIPEDQANGVLRSAGNVNATRRSIGGWEKFKVVK